MSKPRIVITGVAGFIGSNLADDLLAKGYRVIGIDNLAYGVKEQIPEGVEFHQVDIRDPKMIELVEAGDVIFHLAAKNCIADCQEDPVETASINVAGSANVFEAARQKGAKKIVYAESSAMYEGSDVLPTPESEVHPQSFYAISKLCSMYFAETYARFYDVKSTALRYFCVYGPRQDYRRTIPPVMSAFIMKLSRGEHPIIYGSGNKRRDFIHVDDVNAFHEMCIHDARTDGNVYNLGSGVNYSVREIYEAIAKVMNSDVEPVYKDDLPGEAEQNLADSGAAHALGWSPKIGLEEGLRGMAAYLKDQGII